MCDTCKIAAELLHDVSGADFSVANLYFQLIAEKFPRVRFENLAPYHMLIGSTPPDDCIHLDVPAIQDFASEFRAENLQEI